MPMYEYKCSICANVFDVLARMGQAPQSADCPACDDGQGARVFGAGVAIHTGASSSSFDDFSMDDMPGMGMGGHDHGHGHSHDDFGMGGMDDFGMDDF